MATICLDGATRVALSCRPEHVSHAMLDRMPSEQDATRADEAPRVRAISGHVEREFVGRANELALLRTGQETLRQGKGSTFLVTGEAGVGKTRLASQFTSELTAAGIRATWGRCWEAGGAPSYWPWVEVLRQLVESLEAPLDLGTQGRFLAQLAPDLAERFGVAGQDAPTPSDPESARFLMFDAVAGLLRRFASSSPLAVVIDDLHAADLASLLLLTFLARRSEDVPLLIITTLRDREADVPADLAQPLADFARHGTRIELDGLTKSDISSLLEAASGAGVSDDLVSRIHDATAGNAFFVDEVLRSLAGDGLPTDPREPHDLGIPAGVRDAVRQRLATMASATARALELGAVIGREFDAPLVARALDCSAAEILASLQHPLELGMIAAAGTQHGRFQFRHALIRDAIYESLAPARRVGLHRQVGEVLADLAPDRLLGEIAHHFLIAASEGDARFARYSVGAARRALGRMAFEEAVRLYERTLDALSIVAPDERLRCEVLLGLAEAREWANDVSGSRECFEEAAAIARALDATDLFVRAALGVGAVAARKFTATSRYESAPLLILEALSKVDKADSGTRAILLSRLALHHLTASARVEAASLSIQALELARTHGDPALLAEALVARHSVLFGPDAMEERRAIAEEILAIGTALLRPDLILRGHALRFTTRFESGDIRGADLDLEQHRVLAEQLSDPFDQWANLVWRGARNLLEGRFTEAQACADQAIALVHDVPGPHSVEVNGPAANVGQTILILETATRDLPTVLTTPNYDLRFPEMSLWQVAGTLGLMRASDVEGVQLELDRLASHNFANFERNGVWLATLSVISEAIEYVRDRDRANLAYALLLPYAGLQGTASLVASFGSVSRYLGLLAATLDRWPDADRHFSDAAEMNRAMGAQPHLAKTLFDHGRLSIAQAQLPMLKRGVALVEQARALASRLEMPGLLRACDAILASPNISAVKNAPHPLPHRLEKEGNSWVIHYAGKQTPVGSTKGMTYIAELLRHPDREILAIDLIRAFNGEPATTSAPPRSAASRGIIRTRKHFTEDVVDAKARRAYQRQLASLESELSIAEADGDPERVLELRDEIDQLERELSRGIGLGGRIRQSSDVERARISVTRTIHLAMGRIAEAAPEAGAALARCIRTGTYCCYVPDGIAEATGVEVRQTA